MGCIVCGLRGILQPFTAGQGDAGLKIETSPYTPCTSTSMHPVSIPPSARPQQGGSEPRYRQPLTGVAKPTAGNSPQRSGGKFVVKRCAGALPPTCDAFAASRKSNAAPA